MVANQYILRIGLPALYIIRNVFNLLFDGKNQSWLKLKFVTRAYLM